MAPEVTIIHPRALCALEWMQYLPALFCVIVRGLRPLTTRVSNSCYSRAQSALGLL